MVSLGPRIVTRTRRRSRAANRGPEHRLEHAQFVERRFERLQHPVAQRMGGDFRPPDLPPRAWAQRHQLQRERDSGLQAAHDRVQHLVAEAQPALRRPHAFAAAGGAAIDEKPQAPERLGIERGSGLRLEKQQVRAVFFRLLALRRPVIEQPVAAERRMSGQSQRIARRIRVQSGDRRCCRGGRVVTRNDLGPVAQGRDRRGVALLRNLHVQREHDCPLSGTLTACSMRRAYASS